MWRTYAHGPPRRAVGRSLYLQPGGRLSFDPPTPGGAGTGAGYTSYLSDPANPVPYRPRPIQPTYYPAGSNWYTWLVADQRFVDHRPDVASWESDVLTHDVFIAGNVGATLFAATTGSGAGWVGNRIDVYPDEVPQEPPMAG